MLYYGVLSCNGIYPQIFIFKYPNHCFLNSYFGLKGYVCSTEIVLLGFFFKIGILLAFCQLTPFASFCYYCVLISQVDKKVSVT